MKTTVEGGRQGMLERETEKLEEGVVSEERKL